MSEQWKNDSLKVCSPENRFFFPPTKEIWDCFRVCLGPLLPSRETGIPLPFSKTDRYNGGQGEEKFKDAVRWLGAVPSCCLFLTDACYVYVSLPVGSRQEGRSSRRKRT